MKSPAERWTEVAKHYNKPRRLPNCGSNTQEKHIKIEGTVGSISAVHEFQQLFLITNPDGLFSIRNVGQQSYKER
jgi:hypothetical protein